MLMMSMTILYYRANVMSMLIRMMVRSMIGMIITNEMWTNRLTRHNKDCKK